MSGFAITSPFLRRFAFSALTLALVSGCSATAQTPAQTNTMSNNVTVQAPLAQPPKAEQPLTLNQIMANPDWLGIFAQGAYWSDDSQSIYFISLF